MIYLIAVKIMIILNSIAIKIITELLLLSIYNPDGSYLNIIQYHNIDYSLFLSMFDIIFYKSLD